MREGSTQTLEFKQRSIRWPTVHLELVLPVCILSTALGSTGWLALTDPSGPTFCAFTPNGRKIITTGSNDSLRIFKTGSDDEPTNIDNVPDSSTALVAAVRYSYKRTSRHPRHWLMIYPYRMTFSSLVRKTEQSQDTRCRRMSLKIWLRDVLCPFEILRFHRIDSGWLLLASKTYSVYFKKRRESSWHG